MFPDQRRLRDVRKLARLCRHDPYGTAWGGYVLIEVDDPDAFGRYQLHHNLNYGHLAQITFEPIFDLDTAFEQRVREMRK